MLGERAGGTNTLHAMLMAVLVVAAALVVGVVVFDLEGSILPTDTHPSASLDFQYDESAEELVITHQGGDKLDPSNVVILNEGFEEIATWVDEDGITAGESTAIAGVSPNATVYVMWQTGDGEYVVLGSWNGQGSQGTTTASAVGTAEPAVAASLVRTAEPTMAASQVRTVEPAVTASLARTAEPAVTASLARTAEPAVTASLARTARSDVTPWTATFLARME